jgi:hypothetical protein
LELSLFHLVPFTQEYPVSDPTVLCAKVKEEVDARHFSLRCRVDEVRSSLFLACLTLNIGSYVTKRR